MGLKNEYSVVSFSESVHTVLFDGTQMNKKSFMIIGNRKQAENLVRLLKADESIEAVGAVGTVAAWMRMEGLLPEGTCPNWKLLEKLLHKGE